ncbi:MAG: hypothetical protein ACOYBL_11920 [Lachnospiraceae bacterium]|jgi:hypothetical protein
METESRFHYEVHMGGRIVARFVEAENLYIEKDIPQKLGYVILRKGEGDDTFSCWLKEMDTGRILKKRVEIWLFYREKDIVAKWALISARPVEYIAGEWDVQTGSQKIIRLELDYRCIDKWVVNTAEEFHSEWYDIDGCRPEMMGEQEANRRT